MGIEPRLTRQDFSTALPACLPGGPAEQPRSRQWLAEGASVAEGLRGPWWLSGDFLLLIHVSVYPVRLLCAVAIGTLPTFGGGRVQQNPLWPSSGGQPRGGGRLGARGKRSVGALQPRPPHFCPSPCPPAVFSVFTRTPNVQSRLGQDVVLDCGFSAPAAPFSVEWRYQHRGAGRVILAYDGAARRISVAEEGVELFLDPGTSNVSLGLRNVRVHHEGTYICTVYLPHWHAQQALELRTVEPPRVTLRPTPLSVPPSGRAELACEISGYFPLGVSVSWKRRRPGSPQEALLDTWESGQRQSPDGTFSFTSYARLGAVQPQDHGVSYSCHVAHAGLGDAELQKAVTLRVAGSSGPCLEDAVGLFLVAFGLYGILQFFFRRATGDSPKAQKLE
ncbi:tapasin [Sphaerodactylus townsendi]|uniref:tapasin n=1 Tax=Sphaerodactylus townsendi TaxID=933632 RepID=UPI0020261581|nr:tapasin [Sphaerodactylus townsendi]